MDARTVATELLDTLPANRLLGLSTTQALDGRGVVEMPVDEPVRNVIGSLHSSGIIALGDAAVLAAVLSAAPDESTSRRLQPLGLEATIRFHRPVRGAAEAVCELDTASTGLLDDLFAGTCSRIRLTTHADIVCPGQPAAAEVDFAWTIRLAPCHPPET